MGEADHGEEEVVDLADNGDEGLEFDRLGDIGVGVKVVASQHVLLGVGGGEDDNRNLSERFIPLDLSEYLPTVEAGEVEVQQDEIGSGCVLVLPSPAEKFDCELTVVHNVEVVDQLAADQCLAGHEDVAGIILDEEY